MISNRIIIAIATGSFVLLFIVAIFFIERRRKLERVAAEGLRQALIKEGVALVDQIALKLEENSYELKLQLDNFTLSTGRSDDEEGESAAWTYVQASCNPGGHVWIAMDSSWEKVDSKIDDSAAGLFLSAFKMIGGNEDSIFHRFIKLQKRFAFPSMVVASEQEISNALQQHLRSFAEQFGKNLTFMESDGKGQIEMKMSRTIKSVTEIRNIMTHFANLRKC